MAFLCTFAAMTSPQDPPRRRKQKARRTKQLADWRAKNPPKEKETPAAPAKKTPK
jgi:hypothetical protein